jgi:peptidoglycan pentaglycine glycine transferase (the first glycine)
MDIHAEIDATGDLEWDEFVAGASAGHLLQTSRWTRLKTVFGWSAARVGVRAGRRLIAGAQLLFRRLPGVGQAWPLSVAYVPKGPIVDFVDRPALAALLAGIDEACRRRHAIVLKIEPDLPELAALTTTLCEVGFRPSPRPGQPRATILIDLRDNPETWLARMSSKNRYNVRLSERKGVIVHVGAEADVAPFHDLAIVTGHRDSFAVHDLEYYRLAYRLFSETGQVRLFLATHEDRLIAGLMAFACGAKSWYLYGASSNEERQRMPNYALQWAAMNWARDQGCRTYDLWGIPDDALHLEESRPELLKTHIDAPPPGTLWGVYRFKRGFGGDVIRYAGAYDRLYVPWLYPLYRWLESRKQGPPA